MSENTSHTHWLYSLRSAVKGDREEEALSLLQRRTEFDHLDDEEAFGDILHWAAPLGRVSILRAILQSGCHVDVQSKVSCSCTKQIEKLITYLWHKKDLSCSCIKRMNRFCVC